MFAWGWQTWDPAQRIEPFPEILRCIVCCGDGRAPLLENHEMRAPKGFEIYFWVPHVGHPPIVPVGGRCVAHPARDFCGCRRVTGGPLKPSFGLSGAVR